MTGSPPILDYSTKRAITTADVMRIILINAILAMIGAAIGVLLAYLIVPKSLYRTSAMLQIKSYSTDYYPLPPGARVLSPAEISDAGKKMQDALNTTASHQQVLNALKQSTAPSAQPTLEDLSKNLRVNYIRDATLFRVEVVDTVPARAADIANAAADSAIRRYINAAPSLLYTEVAAKPTAPINGPKTTRLPAGIAGAALLPLVISVVRRARSAHSASLRLY